MRFLPRFLFPIAIGAFSCLAVQAGEPLKIAIAGPFSGPVAQYGQMQLDGAQAAIKQINSMGGIQGRTLEAVLFDDACEPKQAVSVANKIVQQQVKYVIGHLCSNSTQPATDVYEDENVLVITGSTNPGITQRGYSKVFRTIGLDTEQGATAAEYIVDKIKPRHIAVIHDKQQYGKGVAMIVHDKLRQMGANVVTVDGINSGEKDFTALISKLKRADVDFVYYGGYHPELALIMRQSLAAEFAPQFMGPEGVGNKDIAFLSGDAIEGMLVTLPTRYDLLPENKEIVRTLEAQNIDPTGPFVWTTYAAVQALSSAIIEVGSEDPNKVADALRQHSYPTAIGDLTWGENGDLSGFHFGVYQWHKDGTGTLLK